MGKPSTSSTSHTIDIGELAASPEVAAVLEKRARYLESLSPEKRVEEEARAEAEERAAALLITEEERDYEERMREAEREVAARHAQIVADRTAGAAGTLTEIGRPFGLSAVAVGKILDEHGLRELVDVYDQLDPHADALRRFEEAKRKRWADFRAEFRPDDPARWESAPTAPPPLRLMRGVVDGVAVHDPTDGRDYWVAAKLRALLEPHRKRKL